jgi:uncharacterized protein (UPF0276 family)
VSFDDRLAALPLLGLGVSTEYGAGSSSGALDVSRLRREHPDYAGFLEVGVEVAKGLDDDDRSWVATGGPTTYHFLDINLDDPADQDEPWLAGVRGIADELRPAWMCGDAGLWHFGPRDRAHMTLLPPILCRDAALDMGDGIRSLRESTGYEVLPENPPGTLYLGDLHLLDFYGLVLEAGDTGMLLDCAHLAIYQRSQGSDPLTGLDGFPLDRVVEIHVAGGVERERDGFRWVEDDHTPDVLPETWEIFEHVVARAPNLKAVVFECERNPLEACLPGFERIADTWRREERT